MKSLSSEFFLVYSIDMRRIFYTILTLIFVFIWFHLVDVGEAVGRVRDVNLTFVFWAIGLGLVSSLIGALRLKTLVSIFGQVSLIYLWFLGWLGAVISLIFPFSIGGFAMAYFISRKLSISYKKAFSILFVDFFLGVLLIFFFAGFAIPFFSYKKLISVNFSDLNSWYILLAVTFLIVITLVFVTTNKGIKFIKGLKREVKEGIRIFSGTKAILIRVVFITLIIAFFGLFQAYFYFLAFGLNPPILDFMLANSLFGVLGLIPGAIAKIGQYETFGVLTLPYLLNLPKERVFAVLLVSHAISITSIAILGVISAYYLKIDRGLITKLRRKAVSA